MSFLTLYLSACGIIILGISGYFAYLLWQAQKLERMPLFPIHEWMAFAASLDAPIRDEACAMIMQRRFSWGWREAFLDWHRTRVRSGRPVKFEEVSHMPIELDARPGVYVLSGFGYYKIGYSTDVRSRVANMNTATPIDLVPIFAFWTDAPQALEKELHKQFEKQRVRREWFQLDPSHLEALQQMQARYMPYTMNILPISGDDQ